MFCKHTLHLGHSINISTVTRIPAVDRIKRILWKKWKTHLYCPEVTREQKDYCHHAGDETFTDELTEQVREDGGDSEEEVEEGGHWMPGDTFSTRHMKFWAW